MRIEHVNLTVADLDRSVDFYCRVFDLHVRWRETDPEKPRAAHVGDESTYIAMFEAKTPGDVESDYDAVGLNHFGLAVDDLEPYRERLAALGITPHFEPTYEPGPRLYFFDPDHIEVELIVA